jgi:hypothetical protein
MRVLFLIFIFFCSKLSSQTCSVFIVDGPEHCGQTCNGLAQANATGQGALSYLWQPGNLTTQQITALCPGSYTVTVTDSVGCVVIDSVNIVTVAPLVVWISNVTDPTCVGCADGCADGNASGGTPGYTYVWTPPNAVSMNYCGMSDSIIYTLCVTDANGCTVCADTSVNDPVGISEGYLDDYRIADVELYDISGKLVWSGNYADWLVNDRGEFSNAIYVWVGYDSSGLFTTRRLIQVLPK